MMNNENENMFDLSTSAGCWRLLGICIAVILLFSCIAHIISTDFGSIKITQVSFDSRGATIEGELYIPAGTNDRDKLPAVIVTHGAGSTLGVTKGFSQELARRGFAVLNVGSYGAGLSEFPQYDEIGAGEGGYVPMESPAGLNDALNFVRTFNFVDQSRIGMVGHSQGAAHVAHAAELDCGFLSFNDIMINILYTDFGLTLNEGDTSMNADTIARSRLSNDQYQHYITMRDASRYSFDRKLKAAAVVGCPSAQVPVLRSVTVAGYQVERNVQVNLGAIYGDFDFDVNIDYATKDSTLESWYTRSAPIREDWYVINDANKTSVTLGNIFNMDVASSPALAQAISNRTARIIIFNPETHTRNIFSSQTAKNIVKYFEQTLAYNRGELGSAAAVPLDAHNILFVWREIMNCIAMFAMIGMLLPITALLLKSKYFASCMVATSDDAAGADKKVFWIFGVVAIVLVFSAVYYINSLFAPGMPYVKFLPLFTSWWLTPIYLLLVALGSFLMLAVVKILEKRGLYSSGIKIPNFRMSPTNAVKTILLSFLLLAFAYLSLTLIMYLFNEDYRMWTTVFTKMKVEYWGYIWRFAIITFPFLLVIGTAINFTIRTDIPEWVDTLLSVVFNSLGVWLCCLINYFTLNASGITFSNWTSSYPLLILVPVTVFLTRKMYKITNSVWLGAAMNSLLISWMLVSSGGYHTYYAQTFFSRFFNI